MLNNARNSFDRDNYVAADYLGCFGITRGLN